MGDRLRFTLIRVFLGIAALCAAVSVQAANFNLSVVDADGNPVSGFRWLLQEDTTWAVDPANPAPLLEQLSTNFHKSYHPPARTQTTNPNNALFGQPLSGNTDLDTLNIPSVTPGRYYLTVFPYSGYAMSGKPVAVLPNATDNANDFQSDDVTVTVEPYPTPTAQIAVYLFHDCFPLNGAPDLPEEQVGSGSCAENADGTPRPAPDFTQFDVVVEEPGGKYGANGGPLLQDAFGNPLGTAYCALNSVLPACAGVAEGDPAVGPGNCPARADGTCADGTLAPNADGTLIVKNLAPGKYGIIVTPPASWIQTSTIEGTPVIDAWVKANEPPFMVEFGLPGPHVFVGFTQERNDLSGAGPATTVSGTITEMHMSRPPSTAFFSGRPFPQCWVAINEGGAGVGGINRYAGPCDANSGFSIADVPPGSYQMKVFDKPLDVVIATLPFTVDPGGTCNGGQSCNFGEVPVFNWFNRLTTYLFNDDNQNGFWDTGETNVGAESGPVNVRWRDGTVYQTFPTDFDGVAPFDESFPWFHWMVAEVGFTDKKATGATIVVDDGGAVNNDPSIFTGFQEPPGIGELAPQAQSENGGLPWRTETGPVLTQAFQGFLGQTNVIQFGKTDYVTLDFSSLPPVYVGENGGISGIVFNTVTRAENDPALAVGEGWEPGVPRVQVNLYADGDINPFFINDPFDPACGVAGFPCGIGDVDWNGNGMNDADDNQIDDLNGDGLVTLSDVDNYPLGWGDPACVNDPAIPGNECRRGPEDVDRDDPDHNLVSNAAAVFDLGDAIAVAWTDSWDDNTPTNCQGQNNLTAVGIADNRCFDGMRNWNQVRPGVFDGGYAFNEYDLAHLQAVNPTAAAQIQGFYDHVNNTVPQAVAANLTLGLLPSDYIVEATTPPGFKTLREHHKNVDFGDQYQPALEALPPACVGLAQEVPPYFAISTKDGSGYDIPAGNLLIAAADAAAPFAGELRPVCDQKKVPLNSGQNAAADFFLVSDVPFAANVTGVILNDLANEFDPNSPNFGEKYAPPLAPVAFYDWNGKEVNRVYADQFGRYNAMVPSTYSANLPQPSGMSPNMLLACMNDAGPIPNPLIGTCDPEIGTGTNVAVCGGNGSGFVTDQDVPVSVIDPFFNPAYSQFCYTFQYMPGSATYLDTPVQAIAAFTNPTSFPVDCEVPQRTPMIRDVRNRTRGIGPFVANNVGPNAGEQIEIRSLGWVDVPNPEWDGFTPATRTVRRDYRFGGGNGTNAHVFLEDADGVRIAELTVNSWNQNRIRARVPQGFAPGEYQVVVTRGVGGQEVASEIGVTLTVGVDIGGTLYGYRQNSTPASPSLYAVHSVPGDFATIQEAIGDPTKNQPGVAPGDLILVAPGMYDELLVMWKPVKLQGWGAGSVTLNARQVPTEKLANQRALLEGLGPNGAGLISALPGQEAAVGGFPGLGANIFASEEGAGILVAGIDTTQTGVLGLNRFNILRNRGARIDGINIIGASQGGGIVVNGYAPYLNISNNRLTANAGFYGGGIRVGHPLLSFEDVNTNTLAYTDAVNDWVRIRHNQIIKNGGIGGAGGGISLHTGADQYRVQDNWICGNFSQGNGGGIGHMGVSNGGRIEHNDILFNESFSQMNSVHGGGIFIGGQVPLTPGAGGVSEGAGNVIVNANRIHGNIAGAGDGGAIAVFSANGEDVANNLGNNGAWWDVSVFNNMMSQNTAGLAGAVTIQDSVEVHVRNNTIAHNDSTATVALAFTPGFFNQSNPMPAGVVSRVHTPAMAALLQQVTDYPVGAGRVDEYITFSDPDVLGNIVFANRSFYWLNYDDPNTVLIETGLFPADCTTAPSCGASVDPIAASYDLAVLEGQVDTGDELLVRNGLLTDTPENRAAYTVGNPNLANLFTFDPAFVNPTFNEGRDGLNQTEFTTLQTAAAFDEGGNFIQVAPAPLTIVEIGSVPNQRVFYDYHIQAGSPAVNGGGNVGGLFLTEDFDGDPRANGGDIGADELP